MFYTYIIFSESRNKFYIGSTKNLEKRIEDHNNSRSTYTKTGKPWTLKWFKTFDSRKEAVQEELRIKKMKSRKYIERLITDR